MTDFSSMDDLFGARRPDANRVYGVVIGIVTNNEDDAGLGRVKVKFPWLSDEDESNWARIAVPMAGDKMGTYFLPEVDDEVLVIFEHGRVDRPFVIGALWNGKQKPPSDNGDGKNAIRIIKSRSGHTITLDDTDGSEKITIADGKEKNVVVLDAAKPEMSITCEGDFTVKAKGKISLESDGDTTITCAGFTADASGSAAIKGAPVNVNDGALKVQ